MVTSLNLRTWDLLLSHSQFYVSNVKAQPWALCCGHVGRGLHDGLLISHGLVSHWFIGLKCSRLVGHVLPLSGFFRDLEVLNGADLWGFQPFWGTNGGMGQLYQLVGKKTGATFNSPQKVNIVIPYSETVTLSSQPITRPVFQKSPYFSPFPNRHLWVLEGLGYEACLWQWQITPRRLHLQCRCFLRRRFRGRSSSGRRGRRGRRRARALLAGFLPGHHGVASGCDPGNERTEVDSPYLAWSTLTESIGKP